MDWGVARVAWGALIILLGLTSPGIAEMDDGDHPVMAAERLLGSADEDAQARSYLPFTRQLTASGVVTGSLADSTAIAGVPPAAMLAALRALGTAIDLERSVRTGDRFHVRYEQTFTMLGHPIGVGRVLWAELKTKARGTVAVHRFRTRDGQEQFWLPNGQAATPPPIRLPLDAVTVTSGFGMRADPLDHPTPPFTLAVAPEPAPEAPAAAPEPSPAERRAVNRAFAGFGAGGQVGGARDAFSSGGGSDVDRVMAARRVREAEARRLEQEAAAAKEAEVEAPPPPPPPSASPPPRKLFMHVGIDLLAPTGAPVRAASDGVVVGAGPNGGYGNWIRINHADRLTTVYGHLSRFAPGIEAGTMVVRGELIGFAGSTGRSTGAHLHFEVLSEGRWINPVGHPATQCSQLAGADLQRFRKQVAASLRERDREAGAR